jgi:hypothetical protein
MNFQESVTASIFGFVKYVYLWQAMDLLKTYLRKQILMMLDLVAVLLCCTILIDQFDSVFIILKQVDLITLHVE